MILETKYELKTYPYVMFLNIYLRKMTCCSRYFSLLGVLISEFARESIYLCQYPSPSSFLKYIWMAMFLVKRSGLNQNKLTPPR